MFVDFCIIFYPKTLKNQVREPIPQKINFFLFFLENFRRFLTPLGPPRASFYRKNGLHSLTALTFFCYLGSLGALGCNFCSFYCSGCLFGWFPDLILAQNGAKIIPKSTENGLGKVSFGRSYFLQFFDKNILLFLLNTVLFGK